MQLKFIEIKDTKYIADCVDICQTVFDLSDKNTFPPAYFSMLIKEYHPLGFILGCFDTSDEKEKLVGISCLSADTEPNSYYWSMVGLLPEYRSVGVVGYNFSVKTLELAKNKGTEKIYGTYDPINSRLGRLYFDFNAIAFKYVLDHQGTGDGEYGAPDSVLTVLHLQRPITRVSKLYDFSEILKKYQIVTDDFIDSPKILYEIPNDYNSIKLNNPCEAKIIRQKSRSFFMEYINNRGYRIIDCVRSRLDKSIRAFCVLEK
jgi:predicted GNAT superfamily acetyltransferase